MGETRSAGSVSRPTLMHYMVDMVDNNFSDLMHFPEELSHVADGHKGALARPPEPPPKPPGGRKGTSVPVS